MSQKSVGAIERGERNITFNGMFKISKGLGVETYQLFFFQYPGLKPKADLAVEEVLSQFKTASPDRKELIFDIISAVLSHQEK